MKPHHKLKEGETVVLQFYGNYLPLYRAEGIFGVNVRVVDVLENNKYRVKPISGHGLKVVPIEALYF